ncbi:MAG: phosphatase PAP2 family protein [Chitinophagales bacterium]|nr:phosphatase PAP2 family protein [Chitinophagales bacterium]
MKKNNYFITIVLILCISFLLISCNRSTQRNKIIQSVDLEQVSLNRKLTQILVKDQFAPPNVSRIYAYCNLIYFYFLDANNNNILKDLIDNWSIQNYTQNLNSIDKNYIARLAFLETAKRITYSVNFWDNEIEKLKTEISKKISATRLIELNKIFNLYYNEYVAYIANDNFKKRLEYPIYKVIDSAKSYQLTPPYFKSAIEPYWSTLRPFFINNVNDYSLVYDYDSDFSTDKNSSFYKENLQMYNILNQNDSIKNIALFWDCNPVQVELYGHAMKFKYRMTPGSHWIEIINSNIANFNLTNEQTAELYMLVSLTMADAFIVCWKDKYYYNSIRPITYINRYIDNNWSCILQTPNFPEYPSGHSTISTAISFILTKYIGENVHIVDDSQVRFNLPVQYFNSFNEAAYQAGESRIYGGIHYRKAIDDGRVQGNKIGTFIWKKYKNLHY